MISHPASVLMSHRKLLLRVTHIELAAQYAGSILGIGWLVLTPLLLLGVYSVVYLFIFRVRPADLQPLQYVLYIFAGLAPFLSTSRAMSSSVTSITVNKDVLLSTVFPIDLLPPKAVLMSQAMQFVGFILILAVSLFTDGLTWRVIFVPIIWFFQLLFIIGITWPLALVNIVLRDLEYVIAIFLFILLVASPIAYTPSMLPAALKPIILLNPFAYFVIGYQKLLILQELPTLFESAVLILISFSSFLMGGWFFMRAKKLMVDYV